MEDVKSIAVAFIGSFFNIWFVGLIVLFYSLLYSLQDALIYHPRNYRGRYANYYSRAHEMAAEKLKNVNGGVVKEIYYTTPGDSVKHTAYWIPPFARSYFKICNDPYVEYLKQNPRKGDVNNFDLWITANGNAGLALDWLTFTSKYVESLHKERTIAPDRNPPSSFLLLDYPGYGENVGGTPSPSTIQTAFKFALLALQKEMKRYYGKTHVRACNEEIYGKESKNRFGLNYNFKALAHSIGSSAVLQFGASTLGDTKLHVEKYVLISPFSSMYEMTKLVVGPLPFIKYILKHDWDNLRYIQKIGTCANCTATERMRYDAKRVKISIIHGKMDEVVPFKMGEGLFEYAKEIKDKANGDLQLKFTAIKRANHNNIVTVAQDDIMKQMMS